MVRPRFVASGGVSPRLGKLLLLVGACYIGKAGCLRFDDGRTLTGLLRVNGGALPICLRRLRRGNLVEFVSSALRLPYRCFGLSVVSKVSGEVCRAVCRCYLDGSDMPPCGSTSACSVKTVATRFSAASSLLGALRTEYPGLPEGISFTCLARALLGGEVKAEIGPACRVAL